MAALNYSNLTLIFFIILIIIMYLFKYRDKAMHVKRSYFSIFKIYGIIHVALM